ncbi:hypothetical protein JXB27_03850 [Candidatus Woesearchaeota archaeon]|nr:hypothetical protein [Candidatus Woesearchaeota archaeon]
MNLLPDGPSRIEESRQDILRSIERFEERYLEENPNLKKYMKESLWNVPEEHKPICSFFNSLREGAFWHVLGFLDGYESYGTGTPLNYVNPIETKRRREEDRIRASKYFSPGEKQELLDIAVNTALLIPIPSSWPGARRGHSLLYEELVVKDDSIFKHALTDSFKKQLNNGAFWEEHSGLSPGLNHGMSYGILEEILTEHFSDLDIDFAPKGFRIFYRDESDKREGNLSLLSDNAVDAYCKFARTIDKNLRDIAVSTKDVQHLVKNYLDELVVISDEGRESDERFKSLKNRVNRLKEPFIQNYLANSDIVRNTVAENLSLSAKYHNDEESVNDINKVLAVIPNKNDMLERIADKMGTTKETTKFIYKVGALSVQEKLRLLLSQPEPA